MGTRKKAGSLFWSCCNCLENSALYDVLRGGRMKLGELPAQTNTQPHIALLLTDSSLHDSLGQCTEP